MTCFQFPEFGMKGYKILLRKKRRKKKSAENLFSPFAEKPILSNCPFGRKSRLITDKEKQDEDVRIKKKEFRVSWCLSCKTVSFYYSTIHTFIIHTTLSSAKWNDLHNYIRTNISSRAGTLFDFHVDKDSKLDSYLCRCLTNFRKLQKTFVELNKKLRGTHRSFTKRPKKSWT